VIEIDARGLRCPWPVLRLARAMRSHDRVTIRADDARAADEIAAAAQVNKWTLTPEGDNTWNVEASTKD
jgi:tRNA 2-thiouridine synthesizing protein A